MMWWEKVKGVHIVLWEKEGVFLKIRVSDDCLEGEGQR